MLCISSVPIKPANRCHVRDPFIRLSLISSVFGLIRARSTTGNDASEGGEHTPLWSAFNTKTVNGEKTCVEIWGAWPSASLEMLRLFVDWHD